MTVVVFGSGGEGGGGGDAADSPTEGNVVREFPLNSYRAEE